MSSSSAKHFVPHRLREPPYGPERLVRLTMGRHTNRSLDGPHLGFAVESTAEQILSRIAPVEGHNPRAVAFQVAHMFAVLSIVDAYGIRVPGSGQSCAGRGKGDCANGLD